MDICPPSRWEPPHTEEQRHRLTRRNHCRSVRDFMPCHFFLWVKTLKKDQFNRQQNAGRRDKGAGGDMRGTGFWETLERQTGGDGDFGETR